jgi:hypothetical protein
MGGRIQVFTTQSSAFRNGVTAPNAVTAAQSSVTNPLAISINNGFWTRDQPQSRDHRA